MLKLVNEDFFKTVVSESTNKAGDTVYKTRLFTNVDLYGLAIGGKASETKLRDRMLFQVNSLCKNYEDYPMMLQHNWNQRGEFYMSGRVGSNVKYDTLVVGIAFPYNGVLKPIEDSSEYRILSYYSGYSSRNSIETTHTGIITAYNKILYLIIAPNLNLFNRKTREFKEYIEIPIETYASDGLDHSTLRKMIVKITDKNDVTATVETQTKLPHVSTLEYINREPCRRYTITKEEYEKMRNKSYDNNKRNNGNKKSAAPKSEHRDNKKESVDKNKKYENAKNNIYQKDKQNKKPKNPANSKKKTAAVVDQTTVQNDKPAARFGLYSEPLGFRLDTMIDNAMKASKDKEDAIKKRKKRFD